MKGRRRASPGEAVGNVYFFGFVLFFFLIFSRFSMLKNHTLLLQSERHICTGKKKHS